MRLIAAARALLQPHFVYRPQQLVRRAMLAVRQTRPGEFSEVMLPWGLPIRCRPVEGIGESIWKRGIFEPHVSEAIWRLLDPGEVAVDAGANIGYMTSIMLRRVGPRGLVIAVEPHPDIGQELSYNVASWRQRGFGSVVVQLDALADRNGDGVLGIPPYFVLNRGVARLTSPDVQWTAIARHHVRLATLDTLLLSVVGPRRHVGLLKVDVEYSELALFRGAADTLAGRRVRDIVYEDHGGPESDAAELLRSLGYTIFRLGRSFSGVVIADSIDGHERGVRSPDYLATLDPRRAGERLRARGWRIFRG
jgi:FkbM family methyltransferase